MLHVAGVCSHVRVGLLCRYENNLVELMDDRSDCFVGCLLRTSLFFFDDRFLLESTPKRVRRFFRRRLRVARRPPTATAAGTAAGTAATGTSYNTSAAPVGEIIRSIRL